VHEVHTRYESNINSFSRIVTMDFASRVIGTVIVLFGWLAFIVLYLAFFADNFDFWQRAAIFIASGAIVIAIVAIFWIRWALGKSKDTTCREHTEES